MPTTVVEENEKVEKKDELLLDSLEIRAYRCFGHLTIERLGRVNLIVGKNNVGKTALLEALWVYANPRYEDVALKILASRDENPHNSSNTGKEARATYKNLFFNREIAQFIVGSAFHAENRISFGHTAGNHFGFRSSHKKEIKNLFIKTNGLTDIQISTLWDDIELTKYEDEVTQSLNLISPDLLRVRLKNYHSNGHLERISFAQVKDLDEPVPLKSFGEGLNRLFGISLALVNSRDGMLFIDEVENGLHYSILPDVWKLIFKTAKELNVQVFATTHSKDCIEAFAQAAHDSPEEGNLIRLVRQGEKIIAKTIEENRLVDAVNYEVEVR